MWSDKIQLCLVKKGACSHQTDREVTDWKVPVIRGNWKPDRKKTTMEFPLSSFDRERVSSLRDQVSNKATLKKQTKT